MTGYNLQEGEPSINQEPEFDTHRAAFRTSLMALGLPPKLGALDKATNQYSISASQNDIDGPIRLPEAMLQTLRTILGYDPVGIAARATSRYVSVTVESGLRSYEDVAFNDRSAKTVQTVTLYPSLGKIAIEPDYEQGEIGEYPESKQHPLPSSVVEELPTFMADITMRTEPQIDPILA